MKNSISKFQMLHSKQIISKESQNKIKGGDIICDLDSDLDGVDYSD